MAKQSKITLNLDGLKHFQAQMKGYRARVGIIGDKAAQDHTLVDHGHKGTAHRTNSGSITNAEIGLIQMLGSVTRRIPARDFLIMPIEYKKREIMKEMGAASVKAALSRGDVKTVFGLLGAIAERFIQEAFYSAGFGQWQENADSTIAAKGSDSPLIDTAQLRRAISSTVVKGGRAV